MKRYLTPFAEGYTVGSKSLVKAALSRGINATVFSAEPVNQANGSEAYAAHTLIGERFHADDFMTILCSSLLPSLRDYDIIHFLPNLAGDIYASFRFLDFNSGPKLIAHLAHPYHPYIRSPFSKFRLSFLCRKVLDHIFCTTEFLVNYFQNKTGMSRLNISCVPFPIDTAVFKPLPQKEKLREIHDLSSERVIVFVGQIEPIRGVFVLLQAFHRLAKNVDDVRLVLSSPRQENEAPYILSFRKMVKELGLEEKVVLLGLQNHLEELYNLADVVVFPYLKPYYYMDPPLTLLESMACGSTIVATDAGAARELIVDGKNGRLIEPGNVEILVKTLTSVLENIDNNSFFGVNARETILSRFSTKRVGNLLDDHYRKILEEETN